MGRAERFALRTAAGLRRREGGGRAPRPGADAAFDGLRPYREGDDPRGIDWGLLARSDRAFVRVARREAGETWLVLVDRSASMGIGDPTKLQAASEAALGLAALGVALGAEVLVVGDDGAAPVRCAAPPHIAAVRTALEGRRAAGRAGLDAALARREVHRSARVFAIGDFFGADPLRWCALGRAGRALVLIQVLADFEIAPGAEGEVEIADPEDGARVMLDLDARAAGRYDLELSHWLERWRQSAARRGARHDAASSRVPFEDRLRRLFEP